MEQQSFISTKLFQLLVAMLVFALAYHYSMPEKKPVVREAVQVPMHKTPPAEVRV